MHAVPTMARRGHKGELDPLVVLKTEPRSFAKEVSSFCLTYHLPSPVLLTRRQSGL